MQIRISLAALPLALTAAATYAATLTSPMLAQAKRLIAAEVADPGSLQFRKLRTVKTAVQGKSLTVACGEYNGKNKMGGYVGFAKFAYEPTALHGVVAEDSGGDIQFFGDSGTSRSTSDTETQARVLAVCLGVPQ